MKRVCYILFYIFFSAVLFSLPYAGLCQYTNYRIKIFTEKEGLNDPVINCLIQDSRGYLWLGTNDGLCRYDGYNFYVFRNKLNDTTSLCDNLIRSIAEDKRGNLWIGTSNGLSKFDRLQGCFYNFYHQHDNPASLSDNSIYDVFVDSRNRLWVKTSDMLELYDENKNIFKHYKPFSNVFNRLSPFSHNVIYEDVFEQIWVGTKDGLHAFDPARERFSVFLHDEMDPMSLSSNAIRTLFEDKKGTLWIGTDNGLNIFMRRAKAFKRLVKPQFKFGKEFNCAVNAIAQDNAGFLWIGTTDGLFRLNPANEDCASFKELFPGTGLPDITGVNGILVDHTGILWIASSKGLVKIDLRPTKFRPFPQIKNEDAAVNVTSIYVDSSQAWAGTWNKGLLQLDPSSYDILKNFSSASFPSLACDNITALHYMPAFGLWIGTANGLFLYNPKQQTFKNYLTSSMKYSIDYFENNRIYCFYETGQNALWIGTENGLFYLDPEKNSIRNFFSLKNDTVEIRFNAVYAITGDNDNNYLYFGTDKGLIKFNPALREIIHYNKQQKLPFRISSNIVYSVLAGKGQSLWIGTNTGLNRYVPAKKRFDVLTEDEGLPGNQIYALKEDGKGNVWISTNKGLACLNISSGQIVSFDPTDGLQGYKFNIGAAFKTNEGKLFFGGTNGFNVFHPDSIIYNPLIPNIVINTIEYNVRKKTTIIHPDTGKIIMFPYQTRFMNIDFSALDFTFPEKNTYAYFLARKGQKGEWTYLGRKHTVSFYNLSPGEYIFYVKGSNNDNVWNERGTYLTLVIRTPFWRTRVALIFYSFLIALSLYLLYLYRTHTLRETNRILTEKEQNSRIIARQKEELAIKNKSITDSIYYAKRIQDALMPSEKYIQRLLPDSFIYIRPRDIVSGDFYWLAERNGKIYLAAVDCTGHGVPGAIMSILGFELFRTTFAAFNEDNAGKFLDKLNYEFARFLTEEQDYNIRDGMDVSLCIFDMGKRQLQFAGAINPLYLIRDDKLIEIKADRFSISFSKDYEITKEYKNNVLELKQDDMIYLFSDGYADQFGGPEGKKYKYRRFRHLLMNIHKMPVEEQRIFLDEAMENWKGDLEQVDDILVIGIKIDFSK